MTTNNLKAIVKRFVTAHTATDTARVKASKVAVEYLGAGGKQADLAKDSGVLPGTVSKYVLGGKALALVPDADADTVKAIVHTAFGDGSTAGDRKALVDAVKAESGAGVVAAAKADKPGSNGPKAKAKGKGKPETVSLKDMTTDAIITLMGDALETIAKRDDLRGKSSDSLVKFAKVATLVGKNTAALPVA